MNKPNAKTSDNNEAKLQLFIPLSGKQGVQLLSKIKKEAEDKHPINVKTCIIYEGTKLPQFTQFPVNDTTKLEQRPNALYYSHCPTYVGETDRRINELMIEICEIQHNHVWKSDFKILNGNYKRSRKRKINIKTLKPTLIIKEKSIEFG